MKLDAGTIAALIAAAGTAFAAATALLQTWRSSGAEARTNARLSELLTLRTQIPDVLPEVRGNVDAAVQRLAKELTDEAAAKRRESRKFWNWQLFIAGLGLWCIISGLGSAATPGDRTFTSPLGLAFFAFGMAFFCLGGAILAGQFMYLFFRKDWPEAVEEWRQWRAARRNWRAAKRGEIPGLVAVERGEYRTPTRPAP